MSKLDPIQLEQLKEIGVQLHQTREQQSKSLEEVAAKTFIPLRLLQAIEVGQPAVLPEPIFIQGFIRRYGDLVGLDGIALSKQFSLNSTVATPAKFEQPKAPVQPPKPQPIVSKPEPPATKAVYTPTLSSDITSPDITSPDITSLSVEPEPPHPESANSNRFNPLYALYGLAGIVIIAGGIFLISQFSPQSSESALQEADPNAANSPSAPPAGAQPEASPVAPPQPSATPSSAIEVSVNLTAASWLRVTADGEIQYEGILPQGEQQTWTANEQLVIRAGNAGAVLVSFNGATAQPLGNPGSVETVTFPEAE